MSLLKAAVQRLKNFRRTKIFDFLAASPIIAWNLFGATQILLGIKQKYALIKLFIETDISVMPSDLVLGMIANITSLTFYVVMAVIFAVRWVSKPTYSKLSENIISIFGAFIGVAILLLPETEVSPLTYFISEFLVIGGTGLAIWSGVYLGRSISILPEARRMVASGPYAFIRHPLYVGEITGLFGVALQHFSALALGIFGVVCVLQFLRMTYEERVLSSVFPEYEAYMARTSRLIPHIY